MLGVSASSLLKWPIKASEALIWALSIAVFFYLDFLDTILCMVYGFLDDHLEERTSPCCCENRAKQGTFEGSDGEGEVSVTLHERRNIFRQLGLSKLRKRREVNGEKGFRTEPRWSDCDCGSCVSWKGNDEQKLHLVVKEPLQGLTEERTENVIFLHGFLSSSSWWTETVFPNLSESSKSKFRLFAFDLLGFGESPKPSDSLYTLKDHLEMIEKSVIEPFELDSFHIVAHSMGCVITMALAAKYRNSVKSVTLVAPPYFTSTKENESQNALNRLAERRVWPPQLFGASVMSWYEHLGRCVCFIVCRNHRIWEWLLKLFSRKRELHFMVVDLTRHTHHSSWNTMHNVLCGGAKLLDGYLEVLKQSKIPVTVVHGDRDLVIPVECGYNVKAKVPLTELRIIPNADHRTVIMGREKVFTRDLEEIWCSSAEQHKKKL
ncbi:hypothetical protein QJS10_CPA05g00641 [Acorus calamus]|uniref:AB hydrolase-1 domain-containing protein n=1 Tax=Acorus calamus TaxID=4465 RepID=A0AAV9ETV9_ACOCL|nr:hypothetical protein QJS10_CPA05g00641 [Acorus calamus]